MLGGFKVVCVCGNGGSRYVVSIAMFEWLSNSLRKPFERGMIYQLCAHLLLRLQCYTKLFFRLLTMYIRKQPITSSST